MQRCTGVITQLQTWRADVAAVKVQFVGVFECGTAAWLFCSQEEPFEKIQTDFLAALSARTKDGYREPGERCDSVCSFLNGC